jgi:Ca2+-binding EF-hand superfamily protein
LQYDGREYRVGVPLRFKKAVSDKGAKAATKAQQAKKKQPTAAAAAGDEAGEGEEDFEAGMRQNAMERDAADADQDGKLDFTEFCAFVRDREEGEFSDADLKARFDKLDEDGSGKVDMSEYLQWSLKDALMRSSSRVVDLFRAWDEDRSGTVDRREFHKAVRALGFDVSEEDAGAVFDSLDEDGSGNLEYKELNEVRPTCMQSGSRATPTEARATASRCTCQPAHSLHVRRRGR